MGSPPWNRPGISASPRKRRDAIAADLFPALSPSEVLAAQEALWRLLARQARLYAPESSSLPAETAGALAESILFTLGAHQNPALLLTPDPEVAFRRGQRRLVRKTAMAHQLWQKACRTVPEVESRSLRDTLESLGQFSRRYDWRFFAQEIPCDVDYQLSQPVPETLLGVDYVLEWLRRLCLEQEFLSCFSPAAMRALLGRVCPDYGELLVNLFEPVAVNALALTLLGEPLAYLFVPPPQRIRLEHQLLPLSRQERREQLVGGVASLCRSLHLQGESLTHYLRDTALNLEPRLSAALAAGR